MQEWFIKFTKLLQKSKIHYQDRSGHYPSRSGLRGGAAGLRAESGGAPPKYIPGGLVTILADSGGLQADSSGLQADFEVRRGLRAAPRRVGGLSAAD